MVQVNVDTTPSTGLFRAISYETTTTAPTTFDEVTVNIGYKNEMSIVDRFKHSISDKLVEYLDMSPRNANYAVGVGMAVGIGLAVVATAVGTPFMLAALTPGIAKAGVAVGVAMLSGLAATVGGVALACNGMDHENNIRMVSNTDGSINPQAVKLVQMKLSGP